MFQLRYANYEKFEDGKLKAPVPRIAFFIRSRGENREKSAMRYARRGPAIRCRLSRLRSPSDIPRPAKSRGKRLRPSNEERAGDGRWDEGGWLRERRGRRWDWNCKYPSSPSLRSRQSHRSISSLLHRPARPLALTPERIRGAHRRACFRENLRAERQIVRFRLDLNLLRL